MALKRKLLGLSLLAVLAVGATAAINASATTGGHFTFGKEHTLILGQSGGFEVFGFKLYGQKFFCPSPNTFFTGTVTNFDKTEKALTITPALACHQEGKPTTTHMNGCDFLFTIGKKRNSDNTFHLVCPGGSAGIVFTVSTAFGICTVTVTPNQTPEGGVGYTQNGMGENHEVTAKATMKGLHAIANGGVFRCGVAEGSTTNTGEITGEIVLKGYETNETTRAGLTATGSED